MRHVRRSEGKEMPDDDTLWTPVELAAYLGLSPATITTMCSRAPARLPPRVAAIPKPRWVPDVVRDWAAKQSGVGEKRKGGRPRL